MNHLLTFIFLIFIFYFYWLIGEFVADCFAIKIKNSTAYVIYGFISVFFISFLSIIRTFFPIIFCSCFFIYLSFFAAWILCFLPVFLHILFSKDQTCDHIRLMCCTDCNSWCHQAISIRWCRLAVSAEVKVLH